MRASGPRSKVAWSTTKIRSSAVVPSGSVESERPCSGGGAVAKTAPVSTFCPVTSSHVSRGVLCAGNQTILSRATTAGPSVSPSAAATAWVASSTVPVGDVGCPNRTSSSWSARTSFPLSPAARSLHSGRDVARSTIVTPSTSMVLPPETASIPGWHRDDVIVPAFWETRARGVPSSSSRSTTRSSVNSCSEVSKVVADSGASSESGRGALTKSAVAETERMMRRRHPSATRVVEICFIGEGDALSVEPRGRGALS